MSLIQNILASILCLITIILMSVYSCEDLKQLLEKEGRMDDSSNNFDEACKAFKGGKSPFSHFYLKVKSLFISPLSHLRCYHYRTCNFHWGCMDLLFMHQRNGKCKNNNNLKTGYSLINILNIIFFSETMHVSSQ